MIVNEKTINQTPKGRFSLLSNFVPFKKAIPERKNRNLFFKKWRTHELGDWR
jgi:hypothetical protein